MTLTFAGAAHEVTGSCTLLKAASRNILIDCGMEQGIDLYKNTELPVAPGDIDAVLLTHAHIDHSGMIPMLVAQGFSGPIYTTEATRRLCDIMLRDSAHIQEFEAQWRTRKNQRAGKDDHIPLYTTNDALAALSLFRGVSYLKPVEVCDGISARFFDAGHLLGSACIEVTAVENGLKKVIVFSGDLGNVNRPFVKDPAQPGTADIVIVESTYGDRKHPPCPDYIKNLTDIIQSTLDRGGNVVIPSFAVGRTQELLYLIREIKTKGLIKGHDSFPVYVDSPLAVEATNIYNDDLREYFDEETLALIDSGVNPMIFDGLTLSVTSDESKAINTDDTPKVIISASGMCEAGRIRHHLKHNLWRPQSTVLFVGYQSAGTLGRTLIDGARSVRLFGERINVAATIATLSGISGHADCDALFKWVAGFDPPPGTVFVNHGRDEVCDIFAGRLKDELSLNAVAPYNGAVYDLIDGSCLDAGNSVHIVRPSRSNADESAEFAALKSAGDRLAKLISESSGFSNKELRRLTEKINSLSDSWKD